MRRPPELIDQQRCRDNGNSIGQRFDYFQRYSSREPSRCHEGFAALVPHPQVVYLSDDFNAETRVWAQSLRPVIADHIKNIVNTLSPEQWQNRSAEPLNGVVVRASIAMNRAHEEDAGSLSKGCDRAIDDHGM